MRIEVSRAAAEPAARLSLSAGEAAALADVLLELAYDHRPVLRLDDPRLQLPDAGLLLLKRESLDAADLASELERTADGWRWGLHPDAMGALGRALELLAPGFAAIHLHALEVMEVTEQP